MISLVSRQQPKYDLSDTKLFGNDAAEDESDDIFKSYFYTRNDMSFFLNVDVPFAIIRAYRGEGKSAILKKSNMDIQGDFISVYSKGSNLSPDVTGENSDKWVRGWKASICNRIAAAIGKTIRFAQSADSMELVSIAEEGGLKKTGIVAYLASRLDITGVPQVKNATARTGEFTENVLQRYNRKLVWLFIDDIDENYQDTSENNLKIASFFTACRDIVSTIPDIRIRTVVRPNIWTVVRKKQEGLSKVEQYVQDIRWNEEQLRSILANRILGYLDRTGQKKLRIHSERIKMTIRGKDQ